MLNPKKKAILDRIERIEEAIRNATEYLDSGKHADWNRFRPMFARKFKDGQELPPHKDWVRNVFLRDMHKSLIRARGALERLGRVKATRVRDNQPLQWTGPGRGSISGQSGNSARPGH